MSRSTLARLATLTTVAMLLGCNSSVVRIGAADSIESQQAAALISKRLSKAGRAAHVVACGTQRECAEAILSSDLELAVLDDETSATIGDAATRIPTGFVRAPRLWVRASNPLTTIDQLSVLSRRDLRIAVSPGDRVRATSGFASLVRAYGLVGVATHVDSSVTNRLRCLDSRECDAVLATSAEVVGNYRALVDGRGALADSVLNVVMQDEDAGVRQAVTQLVPTMNSRPILEVVVASRLDGADGFNAVASVFGDRQVTQVETASPSAVAGGHLWLAPESSPPDDPIEAVVAFDSGRGVPLVLWQSPDGMVDRQIAERLLETRTARMPMPSTPSVWQRRGAPKPREDASRPWLDSVINIVVLAFVIWLVVVIFRRRETTADDSTETNCD